MPTESVALKVVARLRPSADDGKKIAKINGDKISLGESKDRTFNFDYVFGPEVKSMTIYQECCDSMVKRAMLGYNISLIALGTTGSGKSHLMCGTEEDPGIVPSLIHGLYSHINEAKTKKDFFITASFVEVLDDKLTDMLNPHVNAMKIREHPHLAIYVDGLCELVANTEEDLIRLYTQGNRARKMGAKDVGAHRVRSSGIFYIHLEHKDKGSNKVGLRSTLTLADVAGIEADDGAKNLVRVINSKKKGEAVPYRDAKITRLLQESFGGNAMTMILATLSPSEKCEQESLQILQLAHLAKSIKNKVNLNLDEVQKLIGNLREDITQLRNKITRNKQPNKEEILQLENLVQDLQLAKKQTWSEREKQSRKYEGERQTNLANKGILEWVMESSRRGNKEIQENILLIQKEKDQITLEYKDTRKKVDDMKDNLKQKIADYSKLAEKGKVSENETKKSIASIHGLKELLKSHTDHLKDLKLKLKDIHEKQKTEKQTAQGISIAKGNAQLRQAVEAEERHRVESENKAMIVDEMERMKIDVEQEKAEIQMSVNQGKTYTSAESMKLACDLAQHQAERSVVTMQIQSLQQEKDQLSNHLDRAHKRQQDELEIQQLQHFQTFRQYREQFDQQKALLDQRYRKLLEDAVQDAIYLSTRNSELMQENQADKQEIAELKDKLQLVK